MAKTLTKQELKRLFDVSLSCSRYVEHDLTMVQLTHRCGMRVGEVTSLLVRDVLDADGKISTEIVLAAHRTKLKRAKRIFVPKQMQRQLQQYIHSCFPKLLLSAHLFSTQKQTHFKANTVAKQLQRLYAQAATIGASGHSGRRTWLNELSSKGVSVRVLAEMAGHASI